MGIIDHRSYFAPFEYEQAYEYWLKQQQAHWLHTEVPMSGDVQDWQKLSETERSVVGNILKGFTQMEVVVNDYWRRVPTWFPKPEIAMMATAFANMETIHAKSYAYLNESLGLNDFKAFQDEPTARARLTNLHRQADITQTYRMLSLAVFSAFCEGVQLFSSFAVLMNFSRFNKLKGVGQIVAFSSKDESLHSEAGCWLFRQAIAERPSLKTAGLTKGIYEAAETVIQLEDNFIDQVFDGGEVEGLTANELKQYIRGRVDTKLVDLGLDPIGYERGALEWFDYLVAGVEHQDFFAQRPTSYSKGVADFAHVFD